MALGGIGRGKITSPPRMSTDMPNLRAFVMNYKVWGESSSCNEVDGKPVQDTLVFTCDAQRFIVTAKGGEFAEILVENVDESQETATIDAIDRICWLLAFANFIGAIQAEPSQHPLTFENPYPGGHTLACLATHDSLLSHVVLFGVFYATFTPGCSSSTLLTPTEN